ncbi:MAG: peptide chain release factor N(5)-glutamine methyltransferase [Chloroflexia bacterium]
MTIAEALRWGKERLSLHSTTPRLDAEVMLTHLLSIDRAALLARFEQSLNLSTEDSYRLLVARREQGEPIAYITGHKEFYGLDLIITKDVLVPRPETESVVDICLAALPKDNLARFADIGIGSGAILVSVTVNRPNIRAYGTEISAAACAVAQQNCERHGISKSVQLFVGNLLDPIPEPLDVIAANLPYVSPGEAEPDVATWEPQIAVFGGDEDGAATIRQFLDQAPRYILPGGTIVMEVAYSQGKSVSALAQVAFPTANIEVRKDLAGYDRIIIIKTQS